MSTRRAVNRIERRHLNQELDLIRKTTSDSTPLFTEEEVAAAVRRALAARATDRKVNPRCITRLCLTSADVENALTLLAVRMDPERHRRGDEQRRFEAALATAMRAREFQRDWCSNCGFTYAYAHSCGYSRTCSYDDVQSTSTSAPENGGRS